MSTTLNILHITSHIGGGNKPVLVNWIKADRINSHTVCCLNYVSENTLNECKESKIKIFSQVSDFDFIHSLITKHDIVILHYWNFPLMLKFLLYKSLPECRLVVWNHISGLHSPNVFLKQLIDISDYFITTSQISVLSKDLKQYNNNNKIRCIRSTGGLLDYSCVERVKHDTFNILYIGTLDFSKMYENYIEVCYKISKQIDNVHFYIVGDGCDKEKLEQQTEQYNIKDKVTFTGFINNVKDYYAIADIFLYLLSDKHFGTAEQVLGQASMCNAIPIVFNNPSERDTIIHNINGMIASTEDKVVEYTLELYNDTNKRLKLSNKAKQVAQNIYSLPQMIYKWNTIFNNIMDKAKQTREFENCYNFTEGTNCFLNALENNNDLFVEYLNAYSRKNFVKYKLKRYFKNNTQWKSTSKGTIKQYLQFFPEDEYLQELNKIQEES